MLIFKRISSVFFVRTASFVIAFAVVVNILLQPVSFNSQIDFDKISDVQKNVFAAVFFISDAVVKIGLDISGTVAGQDPYKKDDRSKNNKNNAMQSNDAIILANSGQILKTIQYHDGKTEFYYVGVPEVKLKIFCHERMCRTVIFYFIIMMLFFVSVKNVYDSIVYEFARIYFKKPALL